MEEHHMVTYFIPDQKLLSGEGCLQPGARSCEGGCPNFVRDFVRTLSGLVRKIYWTDFNDILYIVYCYGLVVPPLVCR